MKFLVLILFTPPFFAFAKPQENSQWAQIITDGALVYRDANFDSDVIAQLRFGKTFRISKNLSGAFYRILYGPKKRGYIADVDVQIVERKTENLENKENKENLEAPPSPIAKKKSQDLKRNFSLQRWRGISFSQIQFTENTMGQTPTLAKSFYGAKFAGPQLALDGNIPTEINFYYSAGAPDYYTQKTGRSAGGWIFLTDFHWQYYFPQGQNTIAYFGFGPMLRYSKFDVELNGVSSVGYYSMEDIVFGGSFNLGIAQRIASVSVRLEGQYYWELTTYWGLGAAILFAF